MKQITRLLMAVVIMIGLCACTATEPEASATDTSQGPTWQEQYDLGVRYLSEGNYQEAIIAFTAAIEIEPMNADGYLGLAQAHERNGNIELSLETLWEGWSICTEKTIFLDALKRVGYTINENDELQKMNLENEYQNEIERITNIVFPDSFQTAYLTYDQMRSIYEPLIPFLTEYIQYNPDDSRGYTILSEIYCRLNELELCLQIRTQGYENTGDEQLAPVEHNIVLEDYNYRSTIDAWGRTIFCENFDGSQHTYEYGEGQQVVRSVIYFPPNPPESRIMTHNYQYENGRYVSETVFNANGVYDSATTYEYPEADVCVELTEYNSAYYFDTGMKHITTFNEYGKLLHSDSYDASGNLISSFDYSSRNF